MKQHHNAYIFHQDQIAKIPLQEIKVIIRRLIEEGYKPHKKSANVTISRLYEEMGIKGYPTEETQKWLSYVSVQSMFQNDGWVVSEITDFGASGNLVILTGWCFTVKSQSFVSKLLSSASKIVKRAIM